MGSACSGGQSVATADAGNADPDGKNEGKDAEPANEQLDPPQDSGPQETERNGEVATESDQPKAEDQVQESAPAAVPNQTVVQDEVNEDQPNYKLVYFEGLRFRAEPIRLILRYAEVPYEEQLVSFSEWSSMKEDTPTGLLPLLYVNDQVICQSNAIGRFLAKKYGLAGKTNLEMAKVDMLVDALNDVTNEMPPLIMEQDPGKKSDLWHQLKDDVVCPFLDKCIKFLSENNTGWFVGDQLTWADLAISELLGNLNGGIDMTLLEPYPALQAHINGVRSLPRIEEYISQRPVAVL